MHKKKSFVQPFTHNATVECGACGHERQIALGHAYAVECPGCGITIVLGEHDAKFDSVAANHPAPRRKPGARDRKRTLAERKVKDEAADLFADLAGHARLLPGHGEASAISLLLSRGYKVSKNDSGTKRRKVKI